MYAYRHHLIGLSAAIVLAACSNPNTPFLKDDAASLDRARDIALEQVLQNKPELLGGVDVTEKKTRVDDFGLAHVWLTQRHHGVPVFGGEAIVHLGPDGAFSHFTDDLVRGVRVETTPFLDQDEAVVRAVEARGGFDTLSRPPQADLQILQHEGASHLTWRVQLAQLDSATPSRPVVFVDAHSGDEVWSYDNLHHFPQDGVQAVYDVKNRKDYRGAVLASSGDAVAQETFANTATTLAYYDSAFGRQSYDNGKISGDGVGAFLNSYIHFDRDYVNAFWDGERMTYGDGDGVISGPLTVLDVVAHEITHGVTEYEANLIYANESGALNEASSDIMAAAVEAFAGSSETDVYLVGEDCWLEAPYYLRSMSAPATAGDYDYYPERYTGTSDGGGVHWNSGIANLFFYLLAEGGGHPRGKTAGVIAAEDAIGIERAAAIWYHALAYVMTTSTNFSGAREATVFAAQTIDAAAVPVVEAAWDIVGVGAPLVYSTTATAAVNVPEGQERQYGPFTAAGLAGLRISISGDTGDADLYVRRGSAPSQSVFDCRSASEASNEVCEIVDPVDGDYYVMVHAWSPRGPSSVGDVSGATLTVEESAGTPPEPECATAADCTGGDACSSATCDEAFQCQYAFDANLCECNADDMCSGATLACEVNYCAIDNTCGVDSSGCCTDAASCDDGDSCTDDSCGVDGLCVNADNGTCGGGLGSGEACSSNDQCASGNCRSNGRWAGTCS